MGNRMAERDTGTSAANSVRLGEEEFRKLSIDDKRIYLEGVLPKKKVGLISGDPEIKKLTRAMEPQELYWLFKEIGGPDAMKLLGMASPQQCIFILDMELWKGLTFLEDNAVEYLGYLLNGSEDHFLELHKQSANS